MEELLMEKPVRKIRTTSAERVFLQNQIIQLRLEGKSFSLIGEQVNLSERQVRRYYEKFLSLNNKIYDNERNKLFGQIASSFEQTFDEAKQQYAKAVVENDLEKMTAWFRLRQEAMKDYYTFLKNLGLSLYWTEKKKRSRKTDFLKYPY